jgi:DNA-binding GntR family transcriptional regulator
VPDSGTSPGADDESGHLGTSLLYARLRDDLLAGRYAVDVPLVESTLASAYRVSRTPIREALARLEHDGLVERVTRGYRIRTGTSEEVLEIYEARIALESVVAARAAVRRTELDLARLVNLHSREGATDDVEVQRQLNLLWHEALWEASHSPVITPILNRLVAQLRLHDAGHLRTDDDVLANHAEHEQIMSAIRDRDPAGASAGLAQHLVRTRDLRLASFATLQN